MSRLEVYAADQHGAVNLYGEARNSWGGAMHIWQVYAKSIGVYDAPDLRAKAWQIGIPHDSPTLLMLDREEGGGFNRLWRRTTELPPRDQWVLCMTYDRAMIRKEDLREHLLPALVAFTEAGHSTSTLDETIAILQRLAGDPDAQAACFNMTSVCADPWWVAVDDDEEGRRYNIARDSDHWWLHEHFDAARARDNAAS